MDNVQIGEKIINFRRSNNFTIREFSKLTGLSTSLISQLERGMGNPSLNALEAIAHALNIPLFALFIGGIDNESLILRKGCGKKIFDADEKHILYDILTPSPIKSNLEMLIMNLKSKSETSGGFSEHAGEELAFVLEGEVYIMFEKEEFLLYEGDSVRILPAMKHRFRNETSKDIRVLFVKNNPF